MKVGELIRNFKARDSKDVLLRSPLWSDIDDFLHFINSLVDEGADILANTKRTREDEVDFVSRLITNIERNRMISVVAEVEGHLIGHVEVTKKVGYASHVGLLGISVLKDYRDIGIGQELMKEAETQAKNLGVEIIQLEVYSTNSRAIHVYEKLGYKVIGKIPKDIKREEGYRDSLIMVKELI